MAFLGTLRPGGAPRISPVEPYLAAGHLLVGLLAWSGKARDLRADPRYALQSAVTAPDAGEGELKLVGRVVPAGAELRRAAAGAWWTGQPADTAMVVSLGIERAVFVEWDLAGGVMTVHGWSPAAGATRSSRRYP